jgi:hypothetical protein
VPDTPPGSARTAPAALLRQRRDLHRALAPDAWALGNTLPQDWIYSSPLARLSRLKVGSGTPASVFDRSYSYDDVGNVTAITDNKSAANSQRLGPLKR